MFECQVLGGVADTVAISDSHVYFDSILVHDSQVLLGYIKIIFEWMEVKCFEEESLKFLFLVCIKVHGISGSLGLSFKFRLTLCSQLRIFLLGC